MKKYIVEVNENGKITRVPFENETLAFQFAKEMNKHFDVKFYCE